MVASTKMAMPKPKPICCKQIIDTVENPRNTATMIRAVQLVNQVQYALLTVSASCGDDVIFAREIPVDCARTQLCFFADVLDIGLVEPLPGNTSPSRFQYLLEAASYVGFTYFWHSITYQTRWFV